MTDENRTGWKEFWRWAKAAGIRAVKTFCQTLAATIATCATFSEVNWPVALGTSGLALLLSLLTSAAGLPELKDNADGSGEEDQDVD